MKRLLENKILKTVLGFLSVLIIGALGSGVWETALKPLLSWGSSSILDISTLGIEAFKDDVYRDISKGLHEASSLYLAIVSFYIGGYFFLFFTFSLTRKTKRLLVETSDRSEEISEIEKSYYSNQPIIKRELSPEEKFEEMKALNNKNTFLLKKQQQYAYGIFLIGCVVFILVLIWIVKENYINSAITNYRQHVKIVSPYLNKEEILEFESKFSQIQSKANYENIIIDLRDSAKDYDLIYPEFNIW